MGYFFLSGWTPTLLTAAKLPPATAALAAAILQLGGRSARCLCAGGCSGTAFSPSHSCSCSPSPLSARSALLD